MVKCVHLTLIGWREDLGFPTTTKPIQFLMEEMGSSMESQKDRPGFIGLFRTAIVVIGICFVGYLALNRPSPSGNTTDTPTSTSTSTTTPITEFTYTPSPIVMLTSTLTPIIPLTEEIDVIKWDITDVCNFSLRTGVQITGALISGGNPPYWIEASYVYVKSGDTLLPRRKANFAGTTSAYYKVTIDPPLNLSVERWVDLTVKTYTAGEATDWKDQLYFEQEGCGQAQP